MQKSKEDISLKKERVKRAGCFFAVAIPVSLVVITVLATLVIFLILRGEYRGWADRFESSHLSQDFVYISDSEPLVDSIETKIEEFGSSSEEIASLELTPEETFIIFSEQFENSIPESVNVERGYVDSDYASWSIYLQTKYKERYLPWVVIHLDKDEGQGVQLYISSLSLGNYDLTDFGFQGMVDDINRGLADAFVLVNQSDFTGRTFENIELEPGVMIVKGRK